MKRSNQAEVEAASMVARSRNKETVEAILSAAIRILALEGYMRFTLRNIAKRVGLRLAAVQHYYPTKKDMLRAAIKGSIKRWDEPVSRLMLLPRRGGKSRLQAVIKLHLGSCVDDLTGGFFVALLGAGRARSGCAGTSERHLPYRGRALRHADIGGKPCLGGRRGDPSRHTNPLAARRHHDYGGTPASNTQPGFASWRDGWSGRRSPLPTANEPDPYCISVACVYSIGHVTTRSLFAAFDLPYRSR